MVAYLILPKKNVISEKKETIVKFNKFKFNNRPVPSDKNRIVIICCFSEFGCETIGLSYAIPKLLKKYPGKYFVGVGWYGREFLYRNLFDEFWEIDESLMHLKNFSKAFHFHSDELSAIELNLKKECGILINSNLIGNFFIANLCHTCGFSWSKRTEKCPNCNSTLFQKSIFNNIKETKKQLHKIPVISDEILSWAKSIIKDNSVGIIARNRVTYGRNLPINFYEKLLDHLIKNGLNPVWLGEPCSTYPCPRSDILDFSRNKMARDLEKTLAIVQSLKFTIQYWTASTRLASMVGTPFILFESPDQIFLDGQEGLRIELTTSVNKKIVICDYDLFYNNLDMGFELSKSVIKEVEENNFETILGLVHDKNKCIIDCENFKRHIS